MRAWTDYPFTELGDIEHRQAPVREVRVLSYDGNKYCHILVEGVETSVKLGYLYRKPGRLREVPKISVWKLRDVSGRPYWQLNRRRTQKTTWTVEEVLPDGAHRQIAEVGTLREVSPLFHTAASGSVLSRRVTKEANGKVRFDSTSWVRLDTPPSFAGRVRKVRRGRKLVRG